MCSLLAIYGSQKTMNLSVHQPGIRVSRQTRRVTSDTTSRVPHNLPGFGRRGLAQIPPANSTPHPGVCISMEMQLAKLLHRKIVVLGPKLLDGNSKDEPRLETVTLVGIDQAGIWIESEEAANRIADKFRV
jgi:hypothetical protein